MTMTITKKVLQAQVDNINRLLGAQDGKGLCLDYAYGGVRLCKYVGENGGVRDMTQRVTKPEMSRILEGILNTLYAFDLKAD